MILAYITLINDILLELILNPGSLKKGSFHLGSMMSKGGKAITNIFSFVIRNQCQQMMLLKSQFCSSFKVYNNAFDNLKVKVPIIDKVVDTTIHLLCQQNMIESRNDMQSIIQGSLPKPEDSLNEAQNNAKLSKENLNMIALGYKLHSISLKNDEENKDSLSSVLDNPYRGIGKKLMESMGKELLAKGLKAEEPQMSIEGLYGGDYSAPKNLNTGLSFDFNKGIVF